MNTRQAILIITLFAVLVGTSACSVSNEGIPTATVTSPPPTATVTFTPSPIPPTFTPTPLTCLTQPGRIETVVLPSTEPAQEFLIYLPPCYSEMTEQRYPALYLLHGQTYTNDQWVRLGIPQAADQMFFSGTSVPFIIVFPDDRYWNIHAGSSFGDRLVNLILPYVDTNYRTLPDRDHRSLGGLSRGGGWVAEIGFERPDLFGSLGLHSPAVFKGDGYYLTQLMQNITVNETYPRLWLDVGDNDRELKSILELERALTRAGYIHEFHFYAGDHSELYWSAHAAEYLRWYAEAWNPTPEEQ